MKYKSYIILFFIFMLLSTSVWAKDVEIELIGRKFFYTPNLIEVNKGDNVRIRLISKDVHHGLYVDGYDISTSAFPGQDGSLEFIADKTGRFQFRCSVTCGEFHPYMIGFLRVLPNYRLYVLLILTFLFGILAVYFLFKKRKDGKEPEGNKLLGFINLDWRFELTKFKWIRYLFKTRWFPLGFILVNLFIFVIILIAGFVGGSSAGNYNFGIMFVWILWWVALMFILVPGLSRTWCMICPFPIFGEWFQRGKLFGVKIGKLNGLNIKWPKALRNMWIMNFLFLATTFFSGFLTVKPIATFIMLSTIILLAMILGMIFEKRSFCCYVCPVSGFQGLYAQFAMAEIRRKDKKICDKHTPKTCFVGNEKGHGCPWLLTPFDFNKNTYCGMCLECFKSCPHDNMAMNLRAPGADLLIDSKREPKGLDEAWKAFIMLGIAVVFYVAFQGPWGNIKDMVRATTLSGFFKYISFHALFNLLIIPGIFFLFSLFSKLASKSKEVSLKKVFINFAYTLIPLGLGIWIGFSFGIIMPNWSYIVHVLSDPFGWGWNLFGTANIAWAPFLSGAMGLLQGLAILISYVFAVGYCILLSRQVYPDRKSANRGSVPIILFLTLATGGFLWLFLA